VGTKENNNNKIKIIEVVCLGRETTDSLTKDPENGLSDEMIQAIRNIQTRPPLSLEKICMSDDCECPHVRCDVYQSRRAQDIVRAWGVVGINRLRQFLEVAILSPSL
jgi:hypothetical protein